MGHKKGQLFVRTWVDLETIMLSEVSLMEKATNHMILLPYGYKAESNKWTNKTYRLLDTDSRGVATGGEGGGEGKTKRGQICGDGRRLGLGW